MKLTLTNQYAINGLIGLAALLQAEDNTKLVKVSAITAKMGLPAVYLEKLFAQLVAAGILTSKKGHRGGYGLARPLDEIRIYDVVYAVGDEIDMGKNFFKLTQGVNTLFQQMTVADLI